MNQLIIKNKEWARTIKNEQWELSYVHWIQNEQWAMNYEQWAISD